MTGTEIKAIAVATAIRAAGTRRVQELNLSDAQVSEILDALDGGEVAVKPKSSTRRSTRLPSRAVATVSIGGRVFRVRMRNLTRRGASFLYRGSPLNELVPGDTVRLDMPSQDGIVEWQATVIRSRHVDGSIHEVGVEDGPIHEVGVEFVGVF